MEDLNAFILTYLPEKRAGHSTRVAETAEKLATHFSLPSKNVYIAGILHDVCKVMTPETIEGEGLSPADSLQSLYDEFPSVWHAFVGPAFVRQILGIQDPVVLDAIRYHSTGHANMTTESMIVYVADFIEPERSGKIVARCRELAMENITHAVFAIALYSLRCLIEKSRPIHPESVLCFNHYYNLLPLKVRKELVRIVEKA